MLQQAINVIWFNVHQNPDCYIQIPNWMKNHSTLLLAIIELIEQSTTLRISNSLRIVLLDYLILHNDYPTNVKEILTDFNIMFDLLDMLSKLDITNWEDPLHQKSWHYFSVVFDWWRRTKPSHKNVSKKIPHNLLPYSWQREDHAALWCFQRTLVHGLAQELCASPYLPQETVSAGLLQY
jgi:hypothetical protein